MRIKKIINNTLSSLMLVIFILLVAAVVLSKASGGEPAFFGYEIKTVLSGSMEPGIQTGSIVALKPGGDMNRFKPGDVITFRNEDNLLITHRIVEATVNNATGEAVYRTKGDNNDAPDMNPTSSANVVAQYTGVTVPYVGYAMNFAVSKAGSVVLMIVPGLMLLLYALYTSWKAVAALEKKNAALLPASPPPTETQP
ncbi:MULTISPECIES: signal peptidase I SipW [Paenibacillus]|uniref:Signal peptidase I n=1 Tax=Paenibacillus odorifer TaxID=189426 RepID=A0A1R0WYH7_9BACL|nr:MULTISPECIES: signal peptidase I [Paenibacillus]ETT58508.1 signal peptidase [Paenibacillus sp. FSL H8-237]OMD05867.1 signal peptidase I [Paenibacillus odorifer]OMD24383.1 signal peptidase I [Paenibacillus odorifer]OME46104.1 signal peptidase I [Paenibacillus odorifer]OME55249.1 signal peptidase I [Paenibacillus odorifer]